MPSIIPSVDTMDYVNNAIKTSSELHLSMSTNDCVNSAISTPSQFHISMDTIDNVHTEQSHLNLFRAQYINGHSALFKTNRNIFSSKFSDP